MKCQRCSGNGKYKTMFGNTVICDFCYGTGEIAYGDDDRIEPIGNKKPMTNEEWFCGLSTEEKAKMLGRVSFCDFCPHQLSEHCAWTTGYSEDCVYGNKESEELWLTWLRGKHE